jgi:cytochrome o ubiquinol oxidase operon protein cyoD
VAKTGLTGRAMTRLSCLSLFWHFLDIVWICVFTVVYLKGVHVMSQAHEHAADHGSVKLPGRLRAGCHPHRHPVLDGDERHFTKQATVIGIFGFAVVQIIVHLKYFLHLNFTKEGKVNSFSFLFTAMVIVMLVGCRSGSSPPPTLMLR